MTALNVLTNETSIDSITKALGASRKVYTNIADALVTLGAAAEATESFHGLPVALVGVDGEGNADPAVYNDSVMVVVATVGTRVDGTAKKINGLKGIVVFPMPTLESYLANDDGRTWLEKIAEKESAHVAFRAFREADSEEAFLDGVTRAPQSVEDFVTGATRSDAVDDETFSLVWKALRLRLGKEKAALAKLIPTKPEVVKAIRSAVYAASEHPELESKGVFKWLANLVIVGAKAEKLDTSSIESWLAGRDTFVITKAKPTENDFSVLDDLFGGSTDSTDEADEAEDTAAE